MEDSVKRFIAMLLLIFSVVTVVGTVVASHDAFASGTSKKNGP
jgi:hypothetical protein